MYLWDHFTNEEKREKYHIQKAYSVLFIVGNKYQHGAVAGRPFRVNGR